METARDVLAVIGAWFVAAIVILLPLCGLLWRIEEKRRQLLEDYRRGVHQ